jgi:hypothetical protein
MDKVHKPSDSEFVSSYMKHFNIHYVGIAEGLNGLRFHARYLQCREIVQILLR